MYSLNFNTQQYNNYNTVKTVSAVKVDKNEHVKDSKPSFMSNPIMTQVPYNPALTASRLRTELSSKDEKNKYNELVKISDRDTKKNLNMLLKTGILLNADSNDNSTTLDNLYKIATTQRAQGLSNVVILKNTIDTLANPHMITQQFGNIPTKYRAQVEAAEKNKNNNSAQTLPFSGSSDIDVEHSGTCVASSIEFNLADKHPAEFARFAEGLSSPSMSVQKTIKMNNLADNTLDAIWLLNAFEIPYEAHDFDKAKLTFAPDKNAIVRAFIQTVDKDNLERTPLDVLMQSTFM